MLFLAREKGQGCLEYAAILGLVAAAVIVIACLFFLPVVMSGNVPM